MEYEKKDYLMKVLMISTVCMDRNGITAVIMNYYRLCNKEIKIDILANEYISDDFMNEFNSNASSVYIYKRKKNIIGYIFYLYKLLKNNYYDVVHVHGNSATMALEIMIARLLNIKVRIAHCHNSKCVHKIVHRILSPFLNNSITEAIACSKLAGEWIFKNGFEVLPNGIDVGKYKFNEERRNYIRKQLGLENNFILGHVGLFNEQKNHKKIFGVFKELKEMLPEAYLLCVGGDVEIPQNIIELEEIYGIAESTLIFNDREDIADLLMAMDYFIFPSKWEGLGLACIEAETSGLRCLVSMEVPDDIDITSGVKHILLNESNRIWAECIMADKDKKYNRKNAFELIEKSVFNIAHNKSQLLKLYGQEV